MRLATFAWLALVTAGCGKVSVNLADGGGGGDGGDDDGTEVDARPEEVDASPDAAPPACVWSVPSPDAFVSINTTDREDSPTLAGNGLVVFLTRAPADGSLAPDIYDAVRESVDQPFSGARLLAETAGGESEIEIAPDESEIFFLSEGTSEILRAARESPGQVSATGLSGFSPSLSVDGLALYFLDLNHATILRSRRGSIDALWQEPEPLGDAHGFRWLDISADQMSLLLSGGDSSVAPIAIARRRDLEEPWGDPVPAGDAFDTGALAALGKASWDGSSRRMAVSVVLGESTSPPDLYQSTCDEPGQASAATRSTE